MKKIVVLTIISLLLSIFNITNSDNINFKDNKKQKEVTEKLKSYWELKIKTDISLDSFFIKINSSRTNEEKLKIYNKLLNRINNIVNKNINDERYYNLSYYIWIKIVEQIDNLNSEVILINEKLCNDGKNNCYKLKVKCWWIDYRQVMIKAKNIQNSKWAILLHAWWPGKEYYSEYWEYAQKTIDDMNEKWYETYEFDWLENDWWYTYADGKWYDNASCWFTEITKWLINNKIQNTENICATWNSWGAMQISYGLAIHWLDKYLNMVVLSWWPPTSYLEKAIFWWENDPATWPEWLSWLQTTYNVVWFTETDQLDNQLVSALDKSSIVSKKYFRNYDYKTKVNFVESNDITNAHNQWRIYYDKIDGLKDRKNRYYLWDEITEHSIPKNKEWMKIIRKLILDECIKDRNELFNNMDNL